MLSAFFVKFGIYIVAIIVLLSVVDHIFLKPEAKTIEKKVEVIITKHDTVTVERVVEKIKYIRIEPEEEPLIEDTSFVNALYDSLKEQVKAGEIPFVEDNVKFGKHKLWTQYKFPPISKFTYNFLAGPDSLIRETITITKTYDKTPKLSILFGPTLENYEKEIALGINVGVQLKDYGIICSYVDKKYAYNVFYKFNLLR